MRRTSILYEPQPNEKHLHFYAEQKKLIWNTLIFLIGALFLGIVGTFYAANAPGTCIDIFVFCGIFFVLLHFLEKVSYHKEHARYLRALLQFTQTDDIPEMTGREIIHVHDDIRLETDGLGRSIHFKKIPGHTITAVAWHPHQALVAVGSSNGILSIYDLSKEDVLEIEHATVPESSGDIYSVAWSPDGQWLASSGENKWIYIWSIEVGLLNIRSTLYEKLLIGDKKIATSLSWSSDSQRVASISNDQRLRIWQAQDGQCMYDLAIPNAEMDRASTVAWSPDGKHLALAYQEHTLLWTTESWDYTILHQDAERIQCLTWSPDSNFLIGGTNSAGLIVWNTQAEQVQQISTEQNSAISAVAFLLNGKLVASRHSNGRLQFRETETWQFLCETLYQENISFLASFTFSADSTLLAMPIMGGHLLRIWEVQPERILSHIPEHP